MNPASTPTRLKAITPSTLRGPYRAGALISLLQLHWFIRLRWAIVVLGFGGLVVERLGFPEVERPMALALVMLALALVNMVWMGVSYFLVRRFHASGQDEPEMIREALKFANAQVGVDLLMLTLILRYTGGIESPMVIFYLFHMAIGSLLLRWWQAALQGIWALILYTGLAVGEWRGWIEPHYPFLSSMQLHVHAHGPYVAGAIAVLACGVFGTLYFMLQIAARLDEGERQLRRAHDALQKSQQAITDLEQRRSRFMQTAAHQLKSPLAGIQTLAGLIRDGVVPDGGLVSTCEKIIERCRAGIGQVTELLTLARVQQADPKRHHGVLVDVGEVAEELCRHHVPQARDKQLELRCHVPKTQDLRAHVDRSDLCDSISNLIDNAIKFTPGPGIVTVSARRELLDRARSKDGVREFVAVTVADTGAGIDPDSLVGKEGPAGAGSVFDAFRRGNEALAARIPGTGLGLSIVREVVEQAGGHIRVHSRPGHGSKFTVMFPARQALPVEPGVRDTRASEIVVNEGEGQGKATEGRRDGGAKEKR